jgi:hypothetical protein
MKGQGSTYDFAGGAAPVSHVEAGLALLAATMTDPLQSPAPQVVPAVALASVPTPH